MASRTSKSHDTTFDRVLGLVRTVVGVTLITHAAIFASHYFRHISTAWIGHPVTQPYAVIVVEVALGLVLAADFLFRLACALIGLLLLVVMMIILVGERLGVSDQARRYPIALFLICLTGLFTGIGEFALLAYLRQLPPDAGRAPNGAAA